MVRRMVLEDVLVPFRGSIATQFGAAAVGHETGGVVQLGGVPTWPAGHDEVGGGDGSPKAGRDGGR